MPVPVGPKGESPAARRDHHTLGGAVRPLPRFGAAVTLGAMTGDATATLAGAAVVEIPAPAWSPLAIARDRCKGCELCVAACPYHLLALDREVVNALGYHPIQLLDAVALHQLRLLRAGLPRHGLHRLCAAQAGGRRMTAIPRKRHGGEPRASQGGSRQSLARQASPGADEGQRGDRRGRHPGRLRRVLRLPDHPAGRAAGVDGAAHAGARPGLRPGGERARRDQHGARRGRDRRARPGEHLEPGDEPHGRGDELHGGLRDAAGPGQRHARRTRPGEHRPEPERLLPGGQGTRARRLPGPGPGARLHRRGGRAGGVRPSSSRSAIGPR